MKKAVMLLALALLGLLCSCSGNQPPEQPDTQNETIAATGEEEESAVDAKNRTVIAAALGIDENNRSIRFLLRALNTVGAGEIRKAEAFEENGERRMDVVAQDGTPFRFYLTRSNGIDGVQNLTTEEWVISAAR